MGTDPAAEIRQIWADTLAISDSGAEDDFFELGGDSLKAAGMIAEIRNRLGVTVPIRDFFLKPHLRTLLNALVSERQQEVRTTIQEPAAPQRSLAYELSDHTAAARTAEGRPVFGRDDLVHLMARMRGDEKHAAVSISALDPIRILYDRVLRVGPESVSDPDRDRFLLSKGHGPMAYYAVLAAKGFIDPAMIDTYGAFHSPLGFHPDRNLITGVEISSGSLGHGLGIAVGLALGLRTTGRLQPRVFVMVGDGELDEGSNHEAITFAAASALDRLTVVVLDNGTSTYGWRGGIATHFAVAGWDAITVSVTDFESMERAFKAEHPGAPKAVVIHMER